MNSLKLKNMKWQICLLLMSILAGLLPAEKPTTGKANAPKSQPTSQKVKNLEAENKAPASQPAKTQEQAKKLQGNPFQYRMGSNKEGFVPVASQKLPVGIRIMAIMIVKDKKPLAVLKVPDMEDPIYCRQGDIVSIEVTADTLINAGRGKSRRQRKVVHSGKSKLKEIVYLKIDSITAQQVVLHPEKNPAGKRVLQ